MYSSDTNTLDTYKSSPMFSSSRIDFRNEERKTIFYCGLRLSGRKKLHWRKSCISRIDSRFTARVCASDKLCSSFFLLQCRELDLYRPITWGTALCQQTQADRLALSRTMQVIYLYSQLSATQCMWWQRAQGSLAGSLASPSGKTRMSLRIAR